MAIDRDTYQQLKKELDAKKVTLVAVSKTKPVEDILALYELGQRDFGENYVQELVSKASQLPKDINWHFIGHLQRNKVKLIVPFVSLIHGVDSLKLLEEINSQSLKSGRATRCLLQVHIATEETKFGMDEQELAQVIDFLNADVQPKKLAGVQVKGLMGMASFTDNMEQVRKEFRQLGSVYNITRHKYNNADFDTLSMGMSSDYTVAVEEGSTMVRIGSLLFGTRS